MPTALGLYYFLYGQSVQNQPPVILLHGAGGSHLNWPPQIRRLSGQHVIALDLPGHGKSDGVGRQNILEYSKVVVAFMNAIKLPPAVMIGHSMGSAIALTLALRYPKRVRGLGLFGGGAKLRVAPEILELASNPSTTHAIVEMVTERSFGPDANPRLKKLGVQQMAEIRQPVLYGDFLACDDFDTRERISKVRVPTLILCGSEDRMTPPKRSEYLRDEIEGAELHIIDGAGHMLMLEQPDEVARLLGDFLEKIS